MYEIAEMKKEHIPLAMEAWRNQFIKHRGNSLPDFLPGGEGVLNSYLVEQMEKGHSLVALKNGRFAGYIFGPSTLSLSSIPLGEQSTRMAIHK